MNTHLDPVTLYKLREFAKRRNRLIAVRGACALIATALVAMSVVAFIDLLLVLPDWARITLSLTGYALAISVLYFTCLRWLLRPADLAGLARMFESEHEELKEKILSAVELGRTDAEAVHDSPQLRALFQKRVASLIKAYKLKVILPTTKILRWPVITFVVVLFCVALTVIPKLRYAQLMARAFAPTANIARVSALRIRIAEPADPEPLVPRGDPVTIVAQLSDKNERKVFLESFTDQAQPMIIEMEPVGNQKYATTVLVARESLTYRVFAAKASTRQYTIRSRRRPHVTRFNKTYRYPPYSRLEDKQVAETTGDLKAIQSTSVDLDIEVDQPVEDAELQIQIAETTQTLQLTATRPNLLRGKIDIIESGTYKVHLVAKETKFENKFAPNYEILALPDLVPDVALTRPESTVIMPSDAIVRLEGAAKDDLGLQTVEQFIRVNNGPWKQTTLAEDPGKQQVIKKNWDLLPLELKPGDRVSTKIVATDLKGNKGESLLSQITISSPGFSVKNLENSKQKKLLQESLVRLAETSKQLQKDFRALRDEFNNNPTNKIKIHDAHLKTQVSFEQVEALTKSAFAAIENITGLSETRIEADDMVLLGQMLSRFRHDDLANVSAYSRLIETGEEPQKEDFDKVVDLAARAEGHANQARYAYREILSHQQARNTLQEVHRLRANHAEMLQQAQQDSKEANDDIKNNAWRRLARQHKAAAEEQQILEEMLDDLSQYADYNQARQAEEVRKKLAEQRKKTEENLKKEEPSGRLADRSRETQDKLREAEESMKNIERNLRSRAADNRRGLAQSIAISANELATLKWRVQDYANKQKNLTELQAKPNIEAKQVDEMRQQTLKAAQIAEHRWGSASGQFTDRADLEDARQSVRHSLVADTANTAAAIDTLHTTATDSAQIEDSAEAISQIEKAYRLLETGHSFFEAAGFLNEMTAQERWEFATSDAFTQPLTRWDYWQKQIKPLPDRLREAKLPKEIFESLRKIIDSEPFRKMDEEANHRDNPENNSRPVLSQMQTLSEQFAELGEQIEPYMAEARKVIAEYAPSIVEQLHAVSKLAEQMEEQTSELTSQIDEQQSQRNRAEAAALLDEQQRLNEHLDTIRDSLRRDANIQNLAEEQGRQRARDADDAIAMLHQPPPKAEDLLAEAAMSPETDAQKHALEQAVAQQAELNDALDLITQHYENLEAGTPEQTRLALRQAEKDSDLARNLDSRYDRLDELARMAQESPDQLRKLLEKELIQNQPMQDELDRIADNTIQQAAAGLQEMTNREGHISERLEKIAERQDRENPILAPITNKANELAKKAQELAARAENLADHKVADAARKSNEVGAKAQQQFDSAKDSLKQGAQQIPKASAPPSAQLAENVEDFARNVDQAKSNLDKAGDNTKAAANDQNRDQANQAAQTARDASNEAQNISNEAGQLAAQLKDLARRRAEADRQIAAQAPPQNQFAQKAKQLAEQAGQMAADDIPQAAKKARDAGAESFPEFAQAAKAAGNAAEQMPTDLSASPAELAEKVEQFAQSMDQAGGDLQSAVGKVNAAKTENTDQKNQAANQTQNAQNKAADLSRQGSELAKNIRDMARQYSDQIENTDRRQREINQMAPEVTDDITRAALHAERLGRADAGPLRQTSQAMQDIGQNELPQARQALETAVHVMQAQPPVEQAYDALASQLENLNRIQADPAESQQNASRSPQTGEMAQWMARTLDRLDAAQLAQDNPQMAQQAQQAMGRTMEAQQTEMALARAQNQAQARAQSRTRNAARNRLASRFSSDRTSADMPPPTGRKLPENPRLLSGDWGKLRTLSATDLMNAQKEAVSEDYREMVNIYFLVISQKSKE
ncbi:MAG: hypothetical protein JW720_03395 [Sedimentisphaerales bacterium]|nr:hypothetical protein [Sedimentisphaerales bacterium]